MSASIPQPRRGGTGRWAWTFARGVIVTLLLLLAGTLLGGATAVVALRAAPGDWAVRVGSGRWGATLSAPALIRVATHPLGLRALAGRRIATRAGTLAIDAGPMTPHGASLVVTCAPCVIDSRVLAARPIRVASVAATLQRHGKDDLHGTLRVDRVPLTWRLRLERHGADLELGARDVPIADVVAAFGDALADLRPARIEGRAGVEIRIALPSRRFAIEPRLEGLAVAGLGAEALVGAVPTPACARAPARALRPTSWLTRAVLAAEDQRFHEHPGWDLDEMSAAWSGVANAGERRRGASTITQQLAKLLYTGDERTLARKLRELLHAADLERALGKARILELYFAIAPWGDGHCGAEAAAWHYFGRPAGALHAAEAVWMASLLRNPERELARWSGAARPSASLARLAAIAHGVRPLGRAARNRLAAELVRFVPPPVVLGRQGDAGPQGAWTAMSR